MPKYNFENEKKIWGALAVIGILIILYLAYWSFASLILNIKLSDFLEDAPSKGIYFVSDQPSIKGFPHISGIHFSGEVEINGTPVIIPELRTSGLLLPGTAFSVDLPNGFAFPILGTRAVIGFDSASLRFKMPKSFPKGATVPDLQKWRQKVGYIEIYELFLQSGETQLNGKGRIGLDQALQPNGQLETETSNPAAFIKKLRNDGLIRSNDASLLSAALNGLASENPITGHKTVKANLTLQNQALSVGPLPVARLPVISWDIYNSPDRPLRSPSLSPVSR